MKNTFRNPLLATAFAGLLSVTLAACGGGTSSDQSATSADSSAQSTTEQTTSDSTSTATTSADAMSYSEYLAAAVDDPIVIEGYVQGKQAWWEGKATLYLQDEDGAYFVYNAECSQDDFDKLVEGQKVKVTGFKTEWSGEVEVAEGATIEIENGNYIATATDVTDMLGTDELIDYQNQKVAFKGLTVAASKDPDGKEVAFLYNYDGSGAAGENNDLYFNVSDGKDTYSFTVESYLTDESSDVYKAVTQLKVGDTVDMEGFLYWYEGANPHITSVTVK